MERQIMERFPGIGCTWRNAAGKATVEYNGFADKENHVGVDENTIFPACSISKFVTAICVMKLHEQRTIDLDAPVNDDLRQWKLLTMDGRESGTGDGKARGTLPVGGPRYIFARKGCAGVSRLGRKRAVHAENELPHGRNLRGHDQLRSGGGSGGVRRGRACGQEAH